METFSSKQAIHMSAGTHTYARTHMHAHTQTHTHKQANCSLLFTDHQHKH